MRSASKAARPPPTAPLTFLTKSWGTRLALDCIEEEFGTTCKNVAEAIVAIGPSTMDEIRRYIASQSADVPLTGPVLTLTRVRAALLVLLAQQVLEVRIPKLLQRNAENDAALKLLAKDVSATRERRKTKQTLQQAFALTAGDDPRNWHYGAPRYGLDVRAVLRRSRHARFVEMMRDEHGPLGRALTVALLQEGASSKDAIIASAARMAQGAQVEAPPPPTAGAPLRAAAPPPPSLILKRKRSASTASADRIESADSGVDGYSGDRVRVQLLEKWDAMVRVGLIVANAGLARFGVPGHLLAAPPPLSSSPDSGEAELQLGDGTAERPSRAAAAAAGGRPSSTGGSAASGPVLWRFGWEAALRRLRDQAVAFQCRCMLRDRGAADRGLRQRSAWAAVVILALLGTLDTIGRPPRPVDERRGAADPSTWGSPLDVRSERVSVEAILVQLGARVSPQGAPSSGAVVRSSSVASASSSASSGRNYEALCRDPASASAEDVVDVLEALAALPLVPVKREDEFGSVEHLRRSYVVNFRNIVLEVQRWTILRIIEERYEPRSARMVDFLLVHGGLDEKSLAEQALIPAKEAKELLFRLVADGIVTVQEADFDHLCSLFTDTCHRSLLNLRRRRHMEVARHRATTEELVNACGNVAPSLEEGKAISGTNVSESAEAMHARLVRNAEMQETNVAKMLAAESRLDETLFILRDLHWRLWMMASAST